MKTFIILSTLTLLGHSLSAQNPSPKATIPAFFLTAEGSSHHWPVWRYNNARVQYLYPKALVGVFTPRVILGFYARPDHFYGPGVAKKVTVEIQMSSKGVKVQRPNLMAWTNHGTDRRIVFKKKTVNFPPYQRVSKPPQKWTLQFKFDRPFVRLGQDLLVDLKGFTAQTDSRVWYVDAQLYGAQDKGFALSYGNGCPKNFPIRVGDFYAGANVPAYSFGYFGAKGDLILAWVGGSKIAAKIPGTSCSLYSPVQFLHPSPVRTKSSAGYAYFTWGKIPFALGGNKLFLQMGGFSQGKLKFSQGLEIHVGTGATKGGLSIYGYATLSQNFNPDRDAPQYYYTVVPILGLY